MRTLLWLVTPVLLFTSATAGEKEVMTYVKKTLPKRFVFKKIEKVPSEIKCMEKFRVYLNDTFEDKEYPIIFYTNGTYVIVGSLLNIKGEKMVNLTKKEMDENVKYNLYDVSKLDLEKAVKIGSGNGKKIVVITDPLCPYCAMADKKLRPYCDEGKITVYVYFLPVHGNHSKKLINYVLSQPKDKQPEVLKEIFEGKIDIKNIEVKETANLKKLVKYHNQVVSELKAQATPTFVLPSGKKVVGNVDLVIKEILK